MRLFRATLCFRPSRVGAETLLAWSRRCQSLCHERWNGKLSYSIANSLDHDDVIVFMKKKDVSQSFALVVVVIDVEVAVEDRFSYFQIVFILVFRFSLTELLCQDTALEQHKRHALKELSSEQRVHLEQPVQPRTLNKCQNNISQTTPTPGRLYTTQSVTATTDPAAFASERYAVSPNTDSALMYPNSSSVLPGRSRQA
jgi:hypothetical protein